MFLLLLLIARIPVSSSDCHEKSYVRSQAFNLDGQASLIAKFQLDILAISQVNSRIDVVNFARVRAIELINCRLRCAACMCCTI
jgi:hypothetical protein